MIYEVEMKEFEPIMVASLRYRGNIMEAGKHMPAVFKAIKGNSNGSPFFCFYKVDEQTRIGEVELCVPTEDCCPGNTGVILWLQ